MRGGRMLIIIGIIVVVGAVAVGALLWIRGRQGTPVPIDSTPEAGEAEPYVPLEGMIVVAAQNIQRGTRITSDTVRLAPWPEDFVPDGALTGLEEVVDRLARVDIVSEMPILEGMISAQPGDLAAKGSDVALQIPPGKVAYALAVSGNSSVAWAVQPGDHVDVIISLLLVELDEEFQTTLPNGASCVQPPEGEGCQSGVMGRLEVLPNGWVVNLTPTGDQRPRMVTQLTVQDAMVLRIGDWPVEGEAVPAEEQVPEGTGEVEGEPAPPARASVEMMTLVVTPQDAMVLKYVEELGASIDLVLRSAGDTAQITTDSVTLQYVFERFNIELPSKLPYGVEPPPLELRPGAAGGAVESGGGGEPVE
jgi:Flp pilus assembly protein CpaB